MTQWTALAISIAHLRALGCRVSLFVDPVPELMPLARELGADRVELFTEPYAALAADGRATEALSPTSRRPPRPGTTASA